MSIALLIATSFSIGFFIESIVGFGGGLIAYSILGFFIDLKTMVLAGIYIGTCSSLYIFFSDYKSFDKKIYFNSFPIVFFGTIFGVFIFSSLSSELLSIGFGALLLLLSVKTFFFDNFILPKLFKNKLIFIGGIAQGVFGTGGPFFINALKKDFQNKSSIRTTMAVFFASFNIIRLIQLFIQKELHFNFFKPLFWTIIPVFIAIKLGHIIHVKINDNFFKKLIAIITFFAGIKFLTNFF